MPVFPGNTEIVSSGVGYSTTETDTRTKWIDGKTIYRRVYSWTSTAVPHGVEANLGTIPTGAIHLINARILSSATGGITGVWQADYVYFSSGTLRFTGQTYCSPNERKRQEERPIREGCSSPNRKNRLKCPQRCTFQVPSAAFFKFRPQGGGKVKWREVEK